MSFCTRSLRRATVSLLGAGLAVIALAPPSVRAQQLWVGDHARVTVDPTTDQVIDVEVRVPDACFGGGSLLSLAGAPGNLKTPIFGGTAVGGPSRFTCQNDLRTTADRFNANFNTGQFFADIYCMTGSPTSCTPQFIQDQLTRVDCTPNDTTLCLNNGRFRVNIDFETFDGTTGSGKVAPFSNDDSGLLYFFERDNAEMLVKVLDACGFPTPRYWVFFAATTNVEFELTVEDTQTGMVKVYDNDLGTPADPVLDVDAFATCP